VMRSGQSGDSWVVNRRTANSSNQRKRRCGNLCLRARQRRDPQISWVVSSVVDETCRRDSRSINASRYAVPEKPGAVTAPDAIAANATCGATHGTTRRSRALGMR
jgi:hypothetical protein